MRDMFPAYHAASQGQLKSLWSKATFSFDANVLLDLYKSEPETNEQFFSVIEKLKDRIWLSNQAALEFYDNRAGIISRARKELLSIAEWSKTAPNLLRAKAANRITEILNEESENIRDFLANDPIESRLNELFSGKVGSPYENLHEKYIEAEQRFKLKVPPGFRDVPDKQDYRKYGDVILWFQLLEHARDRKHSLIFVTGDSKTDWWLVGEQKKKFGPRPELAQELQAFAGVEFHMYSPSQFIKHATEFAFLKVNAPSAKQAVQDLQRIEKEKERITIVWPDSFVVGTSPVAYPTVLGSPTLVDLNGNPILSFQGSGQPVLIPGSSQQVFAQPSGPPMFIQGGSQSIFSHANAQPMFVQGAQPVFLSSADQTVPTQDPPSAGSEVKGAMPTLEKEEQKRDKTERK